MDAARLEEQYNRELEEMTDDIRANFNTGKLKLEDLPRLLTEKSEQACAAADKMIKSNPWGAVGIAVGVGCLVGFLLSNRR